MAIMLRTVDVPTRNVTGFVGGTYNRFGKFYAVRQGDAHSWVEAYLENYGWLTFDPTPPADAAPKSEIVGMWAYLRDLIEATSQRWDRHVVSYDLSQQLSLFTSFRKYRRNDNNSTSPTESRNRRAIIILVVAVAASGAIYFYVRRKKLRAMATVKPGDVRSQSALLATALYEALDVAMGVRGIARSPGTPPLKHADLLLTMAHPLASEIRELTAIYIESRFGGRSLGDEDRRSFEKRVRALRNPNAQQTN